MGQAAPFFPFVGALLGVAAGSVFLILETHLGSSIAALLALVALLLLTGGLHEDGLADVADACRAGRSRETILRILKDSRIGTYGALALTASFLLRWQALLRCRFHPVLGLIAALALSRSAMVTLGAYTPSIGEGLGAAFIASVSRSTALLAIVSALAISVVAVQQTGFLMAGASTLIVIAARAYFLRRIGGINGDCLGAVCQIVETVSLLVLAWR